MAVPLDNAILARQHLNTAGLLIVNSHNATSACLILSTASFLM